MEKYRIKGKGRRCCLGDRIYKISCRASYFAPGRFWRIWWIHPFLQIISSWCNSSFSSNPFLQIILVQNSYSAARNWINSDPPNSSDDLCLFSVFILLLWVIFRILFYLRWVHHQKLGRAAATTSQVPQPIEGIFFLNRQ